MHCNLAKERFQAQISINKDRSHNEEHFEELIWIKKRTFNHILPFQPSYCKILNDLKEADTSESEDREVDLDAIITLFLFHEFPLQHTMP